MSISRTRSVLSPLSSMKESEYNQNLSKLSISDGEKSFKISMNDNNNRKIVNNKEEIYSIMFKRGALGLDLEPISNKLDSHVGIGAKIKKCLNTNTTYSDNDSNGNSGSNKKRSNHIIPQTGDYIYAINKQNVLNAPFRSIVSTLRSLKGNVKELSFMSMSVTNKINYSDNNEENSDINIMKSDKNEESKSVEVSMKGSSDNNKNNNKNDLDLDDNDVFKKILSGTKKKIIQLSPLPSPSPPSNQVKIKTTHEVVGEESVIEAYENGQLLDHSSLVTSPILSPNAVKKMAKSMSLPNFPYDPHQNIEDEGKEGKLPDQLKFSVIEELTKACRLLGVAEERQYSSLLVAQENKRQEKLMQRKHAFTDRKFSKVNASIEEIASKYRDLETENDQLQHEIKLLNERINDNSTNITNNASNIINNRNKPNKIEELKEGIEANIAADLEHERYMRRKEALENKELKDMVEILQKQIEEDRRSREEDSQAVEDELVKMVEEQKIIREEVDDALQKSLKNLSETELERDNAVAAIKLLEKEYDDQREEFMKQITQRDQQWTNALKESDGMLESMKSSKENIENELYMTRSKTEEARRNSQEYEDRMSKLVNDLHCQIDVANGTIIEKDKQLLSLKDDIKRSKQYMNNTSAYQVESVRRIEELESQIERQTKAKVGLERRIDDINYRASKREKELLEGLRLAEDIHASMQQDLNNQINEKTTIITSMEEKNASQKDEIRMLLQSLDISERNEQSSQRDKELLEKDLHNAITETQHVIEEYQKLSNDHSTQREMLETKTKETHIAQELLKSLKIEVGSMKEEIRHMEAIAVDADGLKEEIALLENKCTQNDKKYRASVSSLEQTSVNLDHTKRLLSKSHNAILTIAGSSTLRIMRSELKSVKEDHQKMEKWSMDTMKLVKISLQRLIAYGAEKSSSMDSVVQELDVRKLELREVKDCLSEETEKTSCLYTEIEACKRYHDELDLQNTKLQDEVLEWQQRHLMVANDLQQSQKLLSENDKEMMNLKREIKRSEEYTILLQDELESSNQALKKYTSESDAIIESHEQQLQEKVSCISSIKIELDECKRTKEDLEKSISNLKIQLSLNDGQLQAYKDELGKRDATIDKLESEGCKSTAKLVDERKEVEAMLQKSYEEMAVAKYEHENALEQMRSDRGELIASYQSQLQKLSREHENEIIQIQSFFNNERNILQENSDKIQQTLEEKEIEMRRLFVVDDTLNETRNEMSELLEKLKSSEQDNRLKINQIEKYESNIQDLESSLKLIQKQREDDTNDAATTIESMEQRLALIEKSRENALEIQKQDSDAKMSAVTSEYNRLLEEYADKQKEMEHMISESNQYSVQCQELQSIIDIQSSKLQRYEEESASYHKRLNSLRETLTLQQESLEQAEAREYDYATRQKSMELSTKEHNDRIKTLEATIDEITSSLASTRSENLECKQKLMNSKIEFEALHNKLTCMVSDSNSINGNGSDTPTISVPENFRKTLDSWHKTLMQSALGLHETITFTLAKHNNSLSLKYRNNSEQNLNYSTDSLMKISKTFHEMNTHIVAVPWLDTSRDSPVSDKVMRPMLAPHDVVNNSPLVLHAIKGERKERDQAFHSKKVSTRLQSAKEQKILHQQIAEEDPISGSSLNSSVNSLRVSGSVELQKSQEGMVGGYTSLLQQFSSLSERTYDLEAERIDRKVEQELHRLEKNEELYNYDTFEGEVEDVVVEYNHDINNDSIAEDSDFWNLSHDSCYLES